MFLNSGPSSGWYCLGLEPEFRILPICPRCLEVYPDSLLASICTRCSTFIFKGIPPNRSEASPRSPLLRFPYKDLTSQLTEMLAISGIEDELDKWRTLPRKPDYYQDIFDGRICQTVPGHDGRPFFINDVHDKHAGPDGELRIGLTLGVDW